MPLSQVVSSECFTDGSPYESLAQTSVTESAAEAVFPGTGKTWDGLVGDILFSLV